VTILRYFFEDFLLDTERRELRRGDALVAVEPKVFDLLALLIVNRERVVSRDDLIAHVWGGRIVSEAALARCINGARSAIGDSGEAQRLIKTLQRKGVRFVGEAREERMMPATRAPAGGAEKPTPALALPDRPSIAVLPLDNISGDKDQEYFSDGISEDIITELSRFSELFVIARNSSFQYKNRVVDVRQVGRELGVRYVLQGSIRRDGDRVRISAQLADAVTGTQRWAERYDRQLTDVFAVQDEVARTIAALLAAHVNKAEIERTLNKPPAAWQAYDYYLRAADAHASFFPAFRVGDLYEVRHLLEQSLAIDPNYARACAKLSWTYFSAWVEPLDADYLKPATLDRAHQLARRAFQLDPNLPEAHARLGMVLIRRREHSAGIAAFERALALNPNFTDFSIAHSLVLAGEPARSVEAANRQMRLDPFYGPLVPAALGMAHYMLQQYSQALPPLRECAARAPNMRIGHLWLAATCAQLGQIEEARAGAAEVLRIEPKWTNLGTGAAIHIFRRPEDPEHLWDGLRKAGLPD
jgi:adenylate cyclase